jgi:hypothetical protein
MSTLEQTTPTGAQAAPSALPQHGAGTDRVTFFRIADLLARLAADARDRHERPTQPDLPRAATQPRFRGARTT